MFDTFKIYTHKEVKLEDTLDRITSLGYRRADETAEEGDFSLRGDTLEIFPVNFNFPLRIEWEFETVKKIYSFDKTLNKKIIDYDLLIIIPYDKNARRYSSEDLPLDVVLRIEKGDYVVHSRYGVGRFLGVKKLRAKGKEGYYFEIEYANSDKLYVAKEEAHLVQKYANFSAKRPRLSRLGSKEWTKIKERVEQGIRAFALEILRMQAQRKIIGGFKYSKDGQWQRKFEESFLYEETDDQLKAIRDVKNDMEYSGCMDRIICGDVGYGKTEVAMRAAFKCVVNHKQVAFLVPTTILAYQHYANLSKRLENFPFYVEMLSRFRRPAEQKEILKKLKEGKVDIIVGTHRLLSGDVNFKDLGLLIIDEEQRFGVVHKEKIKKFKVGIDILSLSATPIPRTLYMSLIGMKAISVIRTPPKQRQAIKTKIMQFDSSILGQAITRELDRGGQVFFIHNRIETIGRIGQWLKKILPQGVEIGIIHGRLATQDMEKVMLDFINKRIRCLLSTAIVESGIDIPAANTIIIDNAHRFGLADLHQLRGRVGRLNVQAFAYLLVPDLEKVSSDVRNRLRMIEEFSHLGAGFEVAMSDLELRGAGNILGKEQHGFIWMVGFDLYCRLLKKEIEYLRQTFKIESG
ncbi:MAG: DEAD/DEAH box helicase [Omnitrophica bacterium]|nr:DEAD/DEAH box helicase [Candidatus Omnitrophota bacterium]